MMVEFGVRKVTNGLNQLMLMDIKKLRYTKMAKNTNV